MPSVHLALYAQHLPEISPMIACVLPERSLDFCEPADEDAEATVEKGNVVWQLGSELTTEGEVVSRCCEESGGRSVFGRDVHGEEVVVERLLIGHGCEELQRLVHCGEKVGNFSKEFIVDAFLEGGAKWCEMVGNDCHEGFEGFTSLGWGDPNDFTEVDGPAA
jgi:hypothetical protein